MLLKHLQFVTQYQVINQKDYKVNTLQSSFTNFIVEIRLIMIASLPKLTVVKAEIEHALYVMVKR